jgi:hypothetical protein
LDFFRTGLTITDFGLLRKTPSQKKIFKMDVITGDRISAHSLMSHVRPGPRGHCLLILMPLADTAEVLNGMMTLVLSVGGEILDVDK